MLQYVYQLFLLCSEKLSEKKYFYSLLLKTPIHRTLNTQLKYYSYVQENVFFIKYIYFAATYAEQLFRIFYCGTVT